MIVLDTSALIKATVGEKPPKELWRAITSQEVHVPHLIDYEYCNALRGLLLGGKLLPSRAEGARMAKEGLSFVRHAASVTDPRAWVLRDNFNAYDASYVALAEQLNCPLVTNDAKIESQARAVEVQRY